MRKLAIVLANVSLYGWLKEYTWLKREKMKGWTQEKVIEIAKQYTSLASFRKEQKLAYFAALNNGWFDDLTWLTKVGDSELKFEEVEERARKYKTMAKRISEFMN